MRVLAVLLLIGGVAVLPFVMLHQAWAIRIWQKVRLLLVIYALIILLSAVFGLVFHWNAIYG